MTLNHLMMRLQVWSSWEWRIPIKNRAFGLTDKVFAYGSEERGSIPGRVIPMTQKMVLEAALLNTQHSEVQIKGKVE